MMSRSPRTNSNASEVRHDHAVLLGELVATSAEVTATRARSVKVSVLAQTLARLEAQEVEAAVAWLAGEPRQGKIGVGWSTVYGVQVPPASMPVLTVSDLDGLYARLTQNGVQFLSPPQLSVDGRARVAFCADPDGSMLELVEPVG